MDITKNQQAAPENLLGCDIANERRVGKGKSIWDLIRIIGLVSVLAYMMVILVVWMYRGDYFTAGESNQIIKYAEWFLGGLGIVALFEIVFKQFATIPKQYFKYIGIFLFILVFILIGNTFPSSASNVALGVTPTISSGWTNWQPTSLANIVDGDTNTVSDSTTGETGFAISNKGSDDLDYIQIDLGATHWIDYVYIKLGHKVPIPSNGNSVTVLKVSGDGSSWVTLGTNTTDITSETIFEHNYSSVDKRIRYIRSSVYGPGANVPRIRWYEIIVNETNVTLLTPANTTSLSTPLVTFTWSPIAPGYQLQISNDSTFATTSVDISQSGSTYSTSLPFPKTYFWRVRASVSGEYSDWSNVFQFTLNGDGTNSISGQVYEMLNEVKTGISGATVYISNRSGTWSSSTITSSSGYYIFGNLTNTTTYDIKASRQDIYVDSITNYVTTTLNNATTLDIQLQRCVSGFNCFYNQHYVKFILQNWYGFTKYSGVATTVYKGTDVTPMTVQCTTLNCVTGTDGAVDILLVKDQQYRITFIDASQGISQTFTVTPYEEKYYIIVSTSTGNNWWGTNTTYSEVDSIIVSVSTSSTASTGWVNVTYQDNLAQTTGLIIYLNQTNKTLATSPQIVIQSNNSGAYSNSSKNFSISSYAGNSYIVNVEAKHTTFGNVVRSFGVHFEGLKSTAADFIPSSLKAILAMGFMIFIGAIFGESRRAQGAGIMVVLGWIFLGAGFFAYFGSARIGAGLVMATIVVVMWHFNERRSAEGMQ